MKGIPNEDYAHTVLPMVVILLLSGIVACAEKDTPRVVSGVTTTTVAAVTLATDQTLNPVTPAASWVLYRDPVLSFSLEYPANWQLDSPPPQVPCRSTGNERPDSEL